MTARSSIGLSALTLALACIGALFTSCAVQDAGSSLVATQPVSAAQNAPDDVMDDPTPTPDPTASTQAAPTAQPTATAEPTSTVDVPSGADRFMVDATNVLGVTADARFGYVAARNAWLDPVDCNADAQEALVGVAIGDSDPDDIALFPARLSVEGAVQQLVFSTEGRAAVLVSCGDETERPWLQILDFEPDGSVASSSTRFDLPEIEGASGPYLAGWDGESTVRIFTYPNGEWNELAMSAESGQVLSVQPRSYDDAVSARQWTTSPDGRFTYREIDDPAGRPGCEGTGLMVTIEVDDGSAPRPAIADPDQVFASAADLQFGPDDVVLWRSYCEGFATPFVGVIQPDGTIGDVHYIDVVQVEALSEGVTEYRHFRLSADGFLVAVGTLYRNGEDPQIALFEYDLANDLELAAGP